MRNVPGGVALVEVKTSDQGSTVVTVDVSTIWARNGVDALSDVPSLAAKVKKKKTNKPTVRKRNRERVSLQKRTVGPGREVDRWRRGDRGGGGGGDGWGRGRAGDGGGGGRGRTGGPHGSGELLRLGVELLGNGRRLGGLGVEPIGQRRPLQKLLLLLEALLDARHDLRRAGRRQPMVGPRRRGPGGGRAADWSPSWVGQGGNRGKTTRHKRAPDCQVDSSGAALFFSLLFPRRGIEQGQGLKQGHMVSPKNGPLIGRLKKKAKVGNGSQSNRISVTPDGRNRCCLTNRASIFFR